MSARTPLRVAVLGAGTVGAAVVRAFVEQSERLCPEDGAPLDLAGVAVRDLDRPRQLALPANALTDAPAHLVASPEVDVVVELMGGDEPAHTLVAAALTAGKPVVSANKHVLAHHGAELEAIARRSGAPLRFEAAVGGGIPVLAPMAADLAANVISRVRGIVNGTTNFMLTAMARDGSSYADALAAAQRAGYAEADPTGDVAGADAANKLAILARLAFGTWVWPETITVRPPALRGDGAPGITGLTTDEMAAAAALGLSIKLIASAERAASDSARVLRLAVLPTATPEADPLGRTNGVTNRIEVRAEPLGSVAFSGPGAGGGPTASAVLGDLLAIARGSGSTWAGLPPAGAAAAGSIAGPVESGPTRGWFVLLPAAAARGLGQPGVDVAPMASDGAGVGVHFVGHSLDEVRAVLSRRSGLPDVTLYPVDEPS